MSSLGSANNAPDNVYVANAGLMIGGNQSYPIVQVLLSNYQNATTTTSGSYTDTNYSIVITPKFTTSKLLVLIGGTFYNDTGSASIGASIQLNITGGLVATYAFKDSTNFAGVIEYGSCAFAAYVSLSSVSATTFTLQLKRIGASGTATMPNSNTFTIIELAQ